MSKLFLLLLGLPGVSAFIVMVSAAEGALPQLSSLLLPVIVILLLVLLNGIYVAAEFSIIGVRSTQLETNADSGSKTALHVLSILNSRRQQDQYIATAQLGITIASLGLAMYGEPQIAHFIEPYLANWLGYPPDAAFIHSLGTIIALSLLTYLHVVVGEMVPKSLALTDASHLVLVLAGPMQISQKVLGIPVRVLNKIGNLLLRLFQVPPVEGHARVLSPEELELIVTESAEVGLIKEGEEELIRNIFDFSERVVGQVMTPRTKVQAIPYDIPLNELLTLVTQSRHSRFPVYENDLDHIMGILHLKDLVRQTLKGSAVDIRLLLRTAPAVPEAYPVEMLLAAFKQQRLHMAIVLDEFGGIAGIVTLEDLVEEIVGEVRDEFDLEKEPYVDVSPGVVEVAGNYLVDDLVEDIYLGESEALPDVETVGGLVVSWLGRLPKQGDEYTYLGDVHFTVLDVDRRAVSRVRITFPAVGNGGEEDNR